MASISEPFIRRPVGTTLLAIGLFLVGIVAYRFLPLWFNWGYPEAYARKPLRMDYAIMAFQGILLILALYGSLQTSWRTWPLWGSSLAVCLVYMAVDSRLLYLTPVMPLVISLSAGGGIQLLGKLIPHRFDD